MLHAGIYYEPGSLKASVCVNGASRLREWCINEGLPVLSCGKVITPQKPELDGQLDLLMKRGLKNGAKVEIIDQHQFSELAPFGYTSTGRALWSQNTCVVNPKLVLERLRERLAQRGVIFLMAQKDWKLKKNKKQIILNNQSSINFGHLFNCAGVNADKIAHLFGLGKQFTVLPFRGNYYQMRKHSPFNFTTNLYPVPDLEFPFLGVHITPSLDGTIYLGPTATPAFGRENYEKYNGIEGSMILNFTRYMTKQFIIDKKMRKYITHQAFEWLPFKFLKAARAIVPDLQMEHIEPSKKVGIRAQLYDRDNHKLVEDFLMVKDKDSTHIINAISPAFTASFELADHVLKYTNLK